MQQEKTYYLYRYIRHDNNEPFYIGIGTRNDYNSQGYKNKSIKSMYYRAYCNDRNYICLGIMKKSSYDIEIMYETNDFEHIQDKEKEFISLYGVVYDDSGTLTNLTMGGVSFKPTKAYSRRSVYKRKMNNTLTGINSKKLYMYDLDGNFIEEFFCLKGFNKKYGFGDKEGCGISQSIREKVSCNGYFFSFNYFEKLDISLHKKSITRYPIVKYVDNVPFKIYKSMEDVAKDLSININTLYRIVYKNIILNGAYYKKCNIHELPKIN